MKQEQLVDDEGTYIMISKDKSVLIRQSNLDEMDESTWDCGCVT